ncbi:MAG: hypothetical protein ACOCWC_05890 [Bacteroidota bacterium]
MFIDSHFHPNLQGFTPDKIVDYLDKSKLDQIWLLSWEEFEPPIPQIYRNISVEEVMEAYEYDKSRIVPFYAPDPTRKNLCGIIEEYRKLGIRGYAELKVTARWTDPEITSLLECLRVLKMPLIFHSELDRYHYVPRRNNFVIRQFEKLMNGAFNGISRLYIDRFLNSSKVFRKSIESRLKYFPGYMLDIAELEQQLQAFPDVIFIAHGPLFWKAIAANYSRTIIYDRGYVGEKGISVSLLERYDNLYADISGNSGFNALNRDHEFTKWFLENYYHKLLYGTDNYLLGQNELLKSFNLSKEKLEFILGKNAANIIS